ncbi:MAG: glycosyltransferase [Thermoleophilia bacterium]|nr:glycosyltransferase [Thermoleophilia bacterium]
MKVSSRRPAPRPTRLGVYVNVVYRVVGNRDGASVSTDRAFLLFANEVGRRLGGTVLFGRTIRAERPSDYVFPPGVELAELPHYESLHHLGQVARAFVWSISGIWRGLARVDAVWVFGPNPFSFLFIVLALARRRRVVLGVRQDTMTYTRTRLRGGFWKLALAPMTVMDWSYRMLARRVPTTVVGSQLARAFGDRPSVLPMVVSLVREADIAAAPPRDYSGQVGLLTVGRLDPEKNPLLLVEALAALERTRPGRFRLTWVGRGPLEAAVHARARELGVDRLISLHGYVPFGPELLGLYRAAHAFVHVSLTEGVPQVLIEAMASATPVVATDVGGVSDLLEGGTAGLLVPPADPDALVGALLRLSDEPALRDSLVARGLELASRLTFEAEAERVAAFVRGPC